MQRAIEHWNSGPRDIHSHLAQLGVYFTFGVELLLSENIRTIAAEVPDHLLLSETDNPGGLKWLTGVVGMPSVITEIVEALARLRQTSEDQMRLMLNQNFLHLIQDDPWLHQVRDRVSQSEQ
jgi:Tat protein secretion system quality control protein TatD with DNase activity